MNDPNRITTDIKVDLIFYLKWKSQMATHTEGYQANRVNMWRDIFPQKLLDELQGKEAGDRVQISFKDGEIIENFRSGKLFDVKMKQFDTQMVQDDAPTPQLGRFYPRGLLRGITGVYKANMEPFRCVGLNNGDMTVDFNHPLAGKDLQLSVIIGKVGAKNPEVGGTSNDWMGLLTSGAGMQAPWKGQKTDFYAHDAFVREDNQPDNRFYQTPRFVDHIDQTAQEMVRNTYGRFLEDGMRVLDLMSSWKSHIPPSINLEQAIGLGMNADELNRNPQLNDHIVYDLNQNQKLPFASGKFDTVVNTASIEYLTNPLPVFHEVLRILRPGGHFVVTFSNRWFPSKTIKVWPELHEFERMGLVLDYFAQTDGFEALQTFSIRGLPRPHDDKYFPQLRYSDPVYAVWGTKK